MKNNSTHKKKSACIETETKFEMYEQCPCEKTHREKSLTKIEKSLDRTVRDDIKKSDTSRVFIQCKKASIKIPIPITRRSNGDC